MKLNNKLIYFLFYEFDDNVNSATWIEYALCVIRCYSLLTTFYPLQTYGSNSGMKNQYSY